MDQREINPFPKGIESKEIWMAIRLVELKNTIFRFLDADIEIPENWILEYNELTKDIRKTYQSDI